MSSKELTFFRLFLSIYPRGGGNVTGDPENFPCNFFHEEGTETIAAPGTDITFPTEAPVNRPRSGWSGALPLKTA